MIKFKSRLHAAVFYGFIAVTVVVTTYFALTQG